MCRVQELGSTSASFAKAWLLSIAVNVVVVVVACQLVPLLRATKCNLEYAWRLASFFGKMMSCWPSLHAPNEARYQVRSESLVVSGLWTRAVLNVSASKHTLIVKQQLAAIDD